MWDRLQNRWDRIRPRCAPCIGLCTIRHCIPLRPSRRTDYHVLPCLWDDGHSFSDLQTSPRGTQGCTRTGPRARRSFSMTTVALCARRPTGPSGGSCPPSARGLTGGKLVRSHVVCDDDLAHDSALFPRHSSGRGCLCHKVLPPFVSGPWWSSADLRGIFVPPKRASLVAEELYNVTSYIATATPPQPLVYDNGWMKTAGFSTRGRSQKWNWILRRVMRKWGVEVVDTWTPLEPRFDERADISHYCHRPFFDVAALIWPRICPE
ncbi:hypothetical protein DFJ74DRAFT_236059 [Hyaloraphidium curvatum]|nr:hypothetical protein DFJ74DRAFT_236059 [Hyaloraphidium curvatum]